MAQTLIERWIGEDGEQSIVVVYDEDTAMYVAEERGERIVEHAELTFVRLWLLGERAWVESEGEA